MSNRLFERVEGLQAIGQVLVNHLFEGVEGLHAIGQVLSSQVAGSPRLSKLLSHRFAKREECVVAAGHACVLSGEEELTNHRRGRMTDDHNYK